MEFPIYYIILETMLTLTSTFGVFVIVIVQGSFLLLAYLLGCPQSHETVGWSTKSYGNWNDDDDEGGE